MSIPPDMGLPNTMTEAEYAALAREFHLDAATRQYRLEAVLEHGVVLAYPFKVAVPFEDLVE